jgi:hypothetical protein
MKPLLLDAVRALAQPPEEQIALLGGECVDELALDLDAQPWWDERADVRAALDELTDLLGAMSGPDHAELWTVEALHGRDWHHVRTAARAVLFADRRVTRAGRSRSGE